MPWNSKAEPASPSSEKINELALCGEIGVVPLLYLYPRVKAPSSNAS